jgi:hypothetical protein
MIIDHGEQGPVANFSDPFTRISQFIKVVLSCKKCCAPINAICQKDSEQNKKGKQYIATCITAGMLFVFLFRAIQSF